MDRPTAVDPASGSLPSGGSEQDFKRFYSEHFPRLVAYLLYQGTRAHLAADLAQEAMITAYQRWDAVIAPRSYVWTVAYRAFIRNALHEAELPVAGVPEPTALLPHPEDAEAWLQEQEIMEVLNALPPRQRQVLALTLDGWTPAEIADLLGIHSSAVRSNLKKARRNADQHRRLTREEDP
jgi:RNA polymerase sigma-70 factor (ECF subfamily)